MHWCIHVHAHAHFFHHRCTANRSFIFMRCTDLCKNMQNTRKTTLLVYGIGVKSLLRVAPFSALSPNFRTSQNSITSSFVQQGQTIKWNFGTIIVVGGKVSSITEGVSKFTRFTRAFEKSWVEVVMGDQYCIYAFVLSQFPSTILSPKSTEEI